MFSLPPHTPHPPEEAHIVLPTFNSPENHFLPPSSILVIFSLTIIPRIQFLVDICFFFSLVPLGRLGKTGSPSPTGSWGPPISNVHHHHWSRSTNLSVSKQNTTNVRLQQSTNACQYLPIFIFLSTNNQCSPTTVGLVAETSLQTNKIPPMSLKIHQYLPIFIFLSTNIQSSPPVA